MEFANTTTALMNQAAMDSGSATATTAAEPSTWLDDPVRMYSDLKMVGLSHAKVLYGSEFKKFYDFVVSYSVPDEKYGAFLTCSYEGASKALRGEIHDDPVQATRILVDGLQKDCGALFRKVNIGDIFYHQQGAISDDGIFELYDYKTPRKHDDRPCDDTVPLQSRAPEVRYDGVPRGPRADSDSYFSRRRDN
ncbi:hypothetical protein BDV95DRAFT_669947 [Massariosphaeria phaeospora]|uniref:Uncharacterized protein n=1 Tax=Massariosphaeria phaeospora TaxID=100035 RepID=A0A7C8I5Y6_9PLEO|nr:hypothetical protein BDV95DRAFT_669947 [Massariosphaeria phaeospora]